MMNRFLKNLFLKEDYDPKPENRFSPQYISHFKSITGFDPPTTEEQYRRQKEQRESKNKSRILRRFKDFLLGRHETPVEIEKIERKTSDRRRGQTQLMLPGFERRSGEDRRGRN